MKEKFPTLFNTYGDFMTAYQLGEYLHLSMPTIYGMLKKRVIRGKHAGRSWIVPTCHVAEYLDR